MSAVATTIAVTTPQSLTWGQSLSIPNNSSTNKFSATVSTAVPADVTSSGTLHYTWQGASPQWANGSYPVPGSYTVDITWVPTDPTAYVAPSNQPGVAVLNVVAPTTYSVQQTGVQGQVDYEAAWSGERMFQLVAPAVLQPSGYPRECYIRNNDFAGPSNIVVSVGSPTNGGTVGSVLSPGQQMVVGGTAPIFVYAANGSVAFVEK